MDLFSLLSDLHVFYFVKNPISAEYFGQRDCLVERSLGNAQILKKFFRMLPPFSFSNVLRN